MLRQLFLAPQRAGLLWWVVLLGVIGASNRRELLVRRHLWIVPAWLLFLFAIFVITPWEGTKQVHLAFARLLLQIAPLGVWGVTSEEAKNTGS